MDPFTWVVIIVFAAYSYANAPKAPEPPAASLEDFGAPVAEDGKELNVIFGTVWLKSSNVVWYGDLRSKAIRKKGGKK